MTSALLHSMTRLHQQLSRHRLVCTTGFAMLTCVACLLASCNGGGRAPQSMQQTDHPAPSPQERWQQAQRQLTPGAFAPLVRLPFLFAQGNNDAATLDSVNHVAHVVLFWASWCSDCRQETTALVRLQRAHPHLAWLTVSLDNEAEKARRYVHEHHIDGLHLFDGRDWRGEACTDYAVPLHGIPYMVLVDSEGRIAWSGQHTDSLSVAITRMPKAGK